MGGIFISYRREDSAGHSGRLFDRLREQFGKERVFMDVAGIEPGVDFVEAIDSAVASCDALVVVIGRKWLDCTDAAGKRRLDDPQDFIRLETGAALRRNIRVIPVLVQGAAMPTEKDLPEDLLKLARRQAIALSDAHWDSDTEVLIETLEKVLPGEAAPQVVKAAPQPPAAAPALAPPKSRLVWLISTITAIVVALGGLLSSIESVKHTITGIFSSRKEEKVVVTTPPLQAPPRETTVTVPPLNVTVPNLIGTSRNAAIAQLRRLGLLKGAVESRASDSTPGTVLEQTPAAGSRLPPGSQVNLVIAEKPEQPVRPPPPLPVLVAVPKLSGLTVEAARETLAGKGLVAGAIREKVYDRARPGTVLAQKPRAGEQVEKGAAVEMAVAVAPPAPVAEPAAVPRLTGISVAEAHAALAKAGLRPGVLHKKIDDRARPGTIIDQKPGPGQQVAKGTAVELLVAAASAEAPSAATTAAEKITVLVQGEPTSKRFWGGKNKATYSRSMAALYSGILKDLAQRRIDMNIDTVAERQVRVVEKMLREDKRLCESTGADIIFAATAQEGFASSDVESAYWPELHLVTIVCNTGKRYEQRTTLSPHKDDSFPFEKAMSEAMQKFSGEHRSLLK